MSKESFLGYVPAITKNSLEMLEQYNTNSFAIYLIDPADLAIKALRKDFRALSPETVKTLLSPRMPNIEVASAQFVYDIVDSSDHLYMPDDEVTEKLVDIYSIPENLVTLDRTYYRWQKKNIPYQNEVNDTSIIYQKDYPEIAELLQQEKNKALDPWRQVSSVLTDKDYNIILSNHNSYLPNQYSGEINGDIRSNYSKGIMLEASNAIHAEAALVAEAAKIGVCLDGKKLFVSTFPCPTCAKLISKTGITSLIFEEGYTLIDGQDCLDSAGIEISRFISD